MFVLFAEFLKFANSGKFKHLIAFIVAVIAWVLIALSKQQGKAGDEQAEWFKHRTTTCIVLSQSE